MKKYKTVIVEKNQVERVICNCCGQDIKKDRFGQLEDYVTIKKNWGYNSAFDGQVHDYDICNECYRDWINKFKNQ